MGAGDWEGGAGNEDCVNTLVACNGSHACCWWRAKDLRMSMDDGHPDHSWPRVGRRDVLRVGAAMGLGALAGGRVASARPQELKVERPASGPAKGRAKNVIFMVADGMSTGTLTLADMRIRRAQGRSSWWMGMWGKPGVRRAMARTHSLDSLVTDSAAGGSAWGSGAHIDNGCVNVMPDGKQLLPILVHARQEGKGTGVVTTARVTHATPASFYANSPRRDYEGMIGAQLLERGVDVALGGGAKFLPSSETVKHPEVQIVRTAAELRGAKQDGRLLGVFDSEHVPFVLDRNETIPGLVEMTKVALARLEKRAEGFVLQVEGGRVDHAAHNNDAGSLVREMVEFDETVGAVLEWIGGREDTLLVLTSDHGNANPGLTLYGEGGNKGFARLEQASKSFDWVGGQLHGIKGAPARVEKMAAAVKTASGYELTAADRKLLEECIQDQRVMPFAEANKWPSVLGAILADYYGVAFVSPNHTSDYVEVTAMGPGSEGIGAGSGGGGGCIDNVELHGVMVRAMGLGDGKLLPGMEELMPMPKAIKPD